jgi:hypothetical protein
MKDPLATTREVLALCIDALEASERALADGGVSMADLHAAANAKARKALEAARMAGFAPNKWGNFRPDPAASLAASMSLVEAGERRAGIEQVSLSDTYSGGDEFLRQCARIGTEFESWACVHVAFDKMEDVWPYFLQSEFGDRVIACYGVTELATITRPDQFLAIAKALSLVLRSTDEEAAR